MRCSAEVARVRAGTREKGQSGSANANVLGYGLFKANCNFITAFLVLQYRVADSLIHSGNIVFTDPSASSWSQDFYVLCAINFYVC